MPKQEMIENIGVDPNYENIEWYYNRNKDATNVYTEGKIACKNGKSLSDNPYKEDIVCMSKLGPIFQANPLSVHWEQGFKDEITLINDLVKIAMKYYNHEDGE
jgi:hypothetical protein